MPAKKKKRATLTRKSVLRSAIELADSDGIEALSMRTLASRLGVKAMSLYNHVENKDDLLAGMVEVITEDMQVPTDGEEWQVVIRQRATTAHQVLLRHGWASLLIMSGIDTGPVAFAYLDETLGIFRRAGFSIELGDHAANLVDSYVYGFTLQEINYPFDMAQIREAAARFLPRLSNETYPHLLELTQHIVDKGYKTNYPGVHNFEFGLDLILEGLERKLKAEKKGRTNL